MAPPSPLPAKHRRGGRPPPVASRLAFISTRIDPPKHGKLRHSSGIRWPVPLLTETLDLRADSWRRALCPCHAHAGPLPPLPFPLPPLPPVPPVPPLPLPFFASLGFPCTCAGSSEPTSRVHQLTWPPGRAWPARQIAAVSPVPRELKQAWPSALALAARPSPWLSAPSASHRPRLPPSA